jgi:iron complex transport system substrate-binding protein
MRIFWLLVSTAVALGLAGCQKQDVMGGKAPPSTVERVVSLSPSTTEIVTMLAERVQLAGRTRACNHPGPFDDVPVVADVKPNYEEIARIKPDLIVFDAGLYTEADIAKLEQLGIDTWAKDVHTVDEFIDWLQRSGAMMHAEVRFNEYADRIFTQRQGAIARGPNPKPKVAVLIGDAAAGYMIAGQGSFVADVVRASGGEPIGPDARNFVAANVETLIAQAPDIIVTNAEPDAVLRDPQLRSLPAVKGRYVAGVDGDILLRAGQRVDVLIEHLGRFFQAWGAARP